MNCVFSTEDHWRAERLRLLRRAVGPNVTECDEVRFGSSYAGIGAHVDGFVMRSAPCTLIPVGIAMLQPSERASCSTQSRFVAYVRKNEKMMLGVPDVQGQACAWWSV